MLVMVCCVIAYRWISLSTTLIRLFLLVLIWILIPTLNVLVVCFFFQAEGGIRDVAVTGVQTCALPILKFALRKGAWYRILKLTSTEVVLDVRGKPLSAPRGQLQLSSEPALRWSVVPSPKHTARFPATWGASYAVFPNCRDRAKLEGHPASMRCQRCNGSFEIAWNESSRAAG